MSLEPIVIHIEGTTRFDRLVEIAAALERIASHLRDIEDDLAMEADDREQDAIHAAEFAE